MSRITLEDFNRDLAKRLGPNGQLALNLRGNTFEQIPTPSPNGEASIHSGNQTRTLDVTFNLIDRNSRTLVDTLRNPSCQIQTLELISQNINAAGAQVLSGILQQPHCKIDILWLGSNPLGNEGAKAIAQALTSPNCNLSMLSLSGCQIGDEGIQALAKALEYRIRQKLKPILMLSLNKNHFGEPAARAFAKIAFFDIKTTQPRAGHPKVMLGETQCFYDSELELQSQQLNNLKRQLTLLNRSITGNGTPVNTPSALIPDVMPRIIAMLAPPSVTEDNAHQLLEEAICLAKLEDEAIIESQITSWIAQLNQTSFAEILPQFLRQDRRIVDATLTRILNDPDLFVSFIRSNPSILSTLAQLNKPQLLERIVNHITQQWKAALRNFEEQGQIPPTFIDAMQNELQHFIPEAWHVATLAPIYNRIQTLLTEYQHSNNLLHKAKERAASYISSPLAGLIKATINGSAAQQRTATQALSAALNISRHSPLYWGSLNGRFGALHSELGRLCNPEQRATVSAVSVLPRARPGERTSGASSNPNSARR